MFIIFSIGFWALLLKKESWIYGLFVFVELSATVYEVVGVKTGLACQLETAAVAD